MGIPLPPPAWLRILCLGAFAAALVQIFLLAQPDLLGRLHSIAWDKLLHAAAFGTLAALLWTAVGFQAPLASWLAIAVIGALDEANQLYAPGRTPDMLDVVADAWGAAVATLALARLSGPPSGEPLAAGQPAD
jgi:VanZ family protein